jgi:hypothetical protein
MHDLVLHGVTHRLFKLPFVWKAGGTFELARSPPVLLITVIVGVLVIAASGTSLKASQYGSQGLSLQLVELPASDRTPRPPIFAAGAGTVYV